MLINVSPVCGTKVIFDNSIPLMPLNDALLIFKSALYSVLNLAETLLMALFKKQPRNRKNATITMVNSAPTILKNGFRNALILIFFTCTGYVIVIG